MKYEAQKRKEMKWKIKRKEKIKIKHTYLYLCWEIVFTWAAANSGNTNIRRIVCMWVVAAFVYNYRRTEIPSCGNHRRTVPVRNVETERILLAALPPVHQRASNRPDSNNVWVLLWYGKKYYDKNKVWKKNSPF